MTYKTDADDSRVDKLQSVAGVDGESPSDRAMRLAGDVVPLPYPSGQGAVPDLIRKQGANEDAARKGGVGYDPSNVDFKLLDKLGK